MALFCLVISCPRRNLSRKRDEMTTVSWISTAHSVKTRLAGSAGKSSPKSRRFLEGRDGLFVAIVLCKELQISHS